MSMDDSCAVCADSLEWVAYGACGHREVCSTCVARLRFICDDRRCCICKTESDVVFVTKALGDYTRTIGDFSVFPSDATEGKNGSYWYHEDTGSFFDDSDQYKMIKAMCRLSCSVCDKGEEQGGNEVHRRRGKFRNIEHLKGHLYHDHKLHMCSLCLEGRKVFICEQKLYTRPQLSQHIKTGDSEVDGSESDRGGFMGHPSCEFCRKPFYGDNELYSHMSTEHYTCHICQRQQPGQFEYYKNYDDLEMHFRQGHFLCEDEACLAKKFIVFTSESEMKRHNAMEHGGHMSRSQRNSALQIPTSFQYRRSTEEDRRGRDRDRRRVSRPDSSENQLSVAIQASLETANAETRINDCLSNAQTGAQQREYIESNEIIPPFEVLSTTDSEASARYRQALGNASSNAPLEESSFPPLPMAPTSSQQQHRSQQDRNSMAARLRRRNNGQVKVINSARGWSATNSASSSSSNSQALSTANYGLVSSGNSTSSQQIRPAIVSGPMPSSFPSLPQARPAAVNGLASASSASARNASSTVRATSTRSQQSRPAIVSGSLPSSFPSLPQARPAAGNGLTSASSPSLRNASSTVRATTSHGPNSASSAQARPAIVNGPMPSSYANLAQAKPTSANGLGSASSGSSRVSHSASAPNLVQRGSLDSSLSDFPPVSATLKNKLPPVSSPSVPIGVKDVQTANKSLVEKVRSALENDEDRYAAFKEISAEYRQGVIGTGEYLSYVQQFGLSHLVLDLARLCPDSQKQRELLDTYNAMVRSENARESGPNNSSNRMKGSKGSNKGKGKVGAEAASNPNDTLADSIISTVRKLQANYKPSEDVEVLSKDGYRASKGKSTASTTEEQLKPNTTNIKLHDSSGQNGVQLSDVGPNQNSGGGGGKQKKKTSKFHRVRLGEGSAAALLNGKETEPEEEVVSDSNPSDVRGVWRNGGGQKLVSLTAAKR